MGVFAELARTRVRWTLYQTLPRSGKGLASQTILAVPLEGVWPRTARKPRPTKISDVIMFGDSKGTMDF